MSGVDGAIIDKNNIHSSLDDFFHITSDSGQVRNIALTNNYFHDGTPACGAHADGLQVRGVIGLTLTNNAIDMGAWRQVCGLDTLNAALFLQNANGGNSAITVDGNYFNGGGYIVYIDPASNIRFTNNRFGRDGHYGVLNITASPASFVDTSGNVWDDTGAAIPVP